MLASGSDRWAVRSRVLCVITARGGSKRIPGKNLRMLGGKPLIAWSIEAALTARRRLGRIIVSTDCSEIAAVAREFGAEVPFLRPAELATDEAKSLSVLQHAARWVEREDQVRLDWVLLLQPTGPFLNESDISACLDLASDDSIDSVVSVTASPCHPVFAKKIEDNLLKPYAMNEPEGLRRQDISPPAYVRNGSIYLTRRKVLLEDGSIYGNSIRPYVMPTERSVDIDTELDFLFAELIVARGMNSSR